MSRAALEAQLRVTADRDSLAIYADVLMAEGDPRGELIALELQRPERWPLLARWLASHLKVEPGGDHLHVTSKDYLSWLDEPIGEFCRGVSLLARIEDTQKAVAAIARRPRLWVTRIKLQPGFGTLVLDEAFAAAVPNLVELEAIGGFDLRRFRHPTLSRLIRSINSLEGGESLELPMNLPAVTHCTLNLDPWKKEWHADRITLAGLPALRTLDLSPSDPTNWGNRPKFTRLDVFEWVRYLPVLPRLRSLVLPAVRSKKAAKHVAAIAEDHPALAIHVAQTYSRYMFALPPRVTAAAPWPFPPDDEANTPWKYEVEAPGGTFEIFRRTLASTTQREFDSRDEAFRTAWRELYAALDVCDAKDKVVVAFGVLHRAIAAWRPGDRLESSEDIRARLVAAAKTVTDDQVVTIRVAPKRR